MKKSGEMLADMAAYRTMALVYAARGVSMYV
jgi:hypothetical protein